MRHSSGAKHLVDSLEQRFAQITRYEPVNLVMDLDPNRIDRLDRELPRYIEFLQKLQTEMRHQRANRESRGRRS